jgi:hypothetical protein
MFLLIAVMLAPVPIRVVDQCGGEVSVLVSTSEVDGVCFWRLDRGVVFCTGCPIVVRWCR